MKEAGLKFYCNHCCATFRHRKSFERHVKDIHDNKKVEPEIVLDEGEDLSNQGKYSCELCQKSFGSNGDLTRHVRAIHEQLKYNCEKCNKQFSFRRALLGHIK